MTPAPLLLVHDVGLGASAADLAGLAARLGDLGPVECLDLPGFGRAAGHRGAFTPRVMQQAIGQAARRHGAVHVLAVGLACEFAALAVVAAPRVFVTLALVGPTGLERDRAEVYDGGATNEQPLLGPLLGSRPAGALMGALLAPQRGAHAALAAWWAGALATRGIAEVYARLALPVWVAHGGHGRGADIGALARFGPLSHWHVARFRGGPRPHETAPQRFEECYRAFRAATASPLTSGAAPR